jgi:hypothetical protein
MFCAIERLFFLLTIIEKKYLSNNIIKKLEISHCLRSVKIIRTDLDTQIPLSSKAQVVQHFSKPNYSIATG